MFNKLIVTNAFSINMLGECAQNIYFGPVADPLEWSRESGLPIVSAVGHANCAEDFSRELEIPIEVNRIPVTLEPGTALLVGQYKTQRLPEGATEVPPETVISWWIVYHRQE